MSKIDYDSCRALYCKGLPHDVCIAGVDEAGRGPLAGTVVAAAVVLGPEHGIEGLYDSKKLSEKKRDILYEEIITKSQAWGVASASVAEIDEINILHASLLAMKRAVDSLNTVPDCVLVDGNRLPPWQYRSVAIVKGDSKVDEISAASIIAKVTRDREMLALDAKFPQYGFAKHKGYPTKVHIDALQRYGPCKVHRLSYAPVKRALESS
ncbi:MAG: ribonuclease HII [Alteromonadaceae bacterium]|nr:MAG: ribonuclease HII [Alteromonadaceae bacterium]